MSANNLSGVAAEVVPLPPVGGVDGGGAGEAGATLPDGEVAIDENISVGLEYFIGEFGDRDRATRPGKAERRARRCRVRIVDQCRDEGRNGTGDSGRRDRIAIHVETEHHVGKCRFERQRADRGIGNRRQHGAGDFLGMLLHQHGELVERGLMRRGGKSAAFRIISLLGFRHHPTDHQCLAHSRRIVGRRNLDGQRPAGVIAGSGQRVMGILGPGGLDSGRIAMHGLDIAVYEK